LRQLDEISWQLNVLRARAQRRWGPVHDLMLSQIAEVEDSVAWLKAALKTVNPATAGRGPSR
jgi:hypothetical protein